jgi:hypothetical protein
MLAHVRLMDDQVSSIIAHFFAKMGNGWEVPMTGWHDGDKE